MSAKRALLRKSLREAGWRGKKQKRLRGATPYSAAQTVAAVRAILKMRDQLKEK